MIKVKLYKAENEISESIIRERLLQKQYSDEKGFGFDIIDDDKDLLVQFIQRTIRKQEFELPDGEMSEIETVSYTKVKFGIRFKTKLALYAINPPRSMKLPFEMIHTVFGEDSGLKPVDIELKNLIEIFGSKFDLLLKSMSLSNIHCDAFTLAKTKVASTRDISPYYVDNFKKTSAVIDTVHMVVNGIDTELSRTGRFRVSEANLPSLILMLEHSFQ
ncbi:hypothetical protein INR79_05635 [Vibrio sp. SCSIO 43132]|uniref:hypothetical protein n=1 Tax=Vibrio sp. SCSIO 43132 TaxID=2779363 RepID=UPI001CA8A671|nr:hypothetical protein [Vibrio sp. SCSIO 43132]UAB71385.1 hypothetical protein INR79_05635 [Vibrio sp. SCSIO 43132]